VTRAAEQLLVGAVNAVKITDGQRTPTVAVAQIVQTANQFHGQESGMRTTDYTADSDADRRCRGRSPAA
jgi:hypothetical protein